MPKTIALRPSLLPLPLPTSHYVCESWWTCHSAPASKHQYRERLDSILATSQGLSIIQPAVLERLDLVTTPERGWKGQVPTWYGIPGRVARVTIWLAIRDEPGTYQEFSLLALFPRRDLEDAPPFVHLGTQFLLEHTAAIHLDCSSPAGEGRLVMP
jgi:hypothetical protein